MKIEMDMFPAMNPSVQDFKADKRFEGITQHT